MEKSFSSLAELRAEIDFLKVKAFKDEEAVKAGFKSPSAIFGIFKTDSGKKSFTQDLMQQDLITNISRVLIPLLLNGVFFKKSGFITKTLITFLSQKAAKQVNSDKVSGLLDKFTSMFKGNGRPQRTATIRDYGIPPDSETY
ncbi:MAG: hypothetical protein H7Y13_11240 [Sphingobacteriaceae bacterium]|nr:hypothetical protein [Sphingobacteriaceae bacterium]